MAINLNDIIALSGQLSQQQAAQTQQISNMQMQQGELGQQIAQNTRDAADRAYRAEVFAEEGKLKAQQAARANATAMGMNAVDASEIITSLSQQLRFDALAYQAAEQKVIDIEKNANLLANPVGWLNDVINGDSARAERDAYQRRHETTASQLNNMHALTQTNVQTQMAIAETSNADTIRDIAEANRLLAENNAIKAEVDSLSYTVEGINTLRQYGSAEFNRRLQLYNVVSQEARHAEQMEAQRMNLETQRRRLELEEESQQSWDYTVENINIARRTQGLRELPAGVIRRDYGSNTPQGQQMLEMELLGQASRDRQSAVYGFSPGHSMFTIQENGGVLPANLDDEVVENMQQAQQLMLQEAEAAAQLPAGNTDNGLNKDNYNDRNAQIQAFNSIFRGIQNEADQRFGSRPVPITTIASEYPQFENSAVFQQVVKPAIDAGQTHLTPQEITTRTAALYKDGAITEPEAVQGLFELSRANLDLYNALSGRTAVGAQVPTDFIVPVPTGESRRTIDPRAALFSPLAIGALKTNDVYENVDMLNPTDISHFLQRFRSNAVAREMQRNATEQRARPTSRQMGAPY